MKRWLPAVLAICVAPRAAADPYVLRADAFATTASPAGLVVLQADAQASANVNAEAVVWTGNLAATDNAAGDVLVIALRGRTPDGRANGTFGRFVATLGALRPVHLDGAGGRVELPHRFAAEAFAGVPVEPDLMTARTWDWIVGARASRKLGGYGSVGVAYLERRDDGKLAAEEVGADAGLALGKRDDVGARVAYDVANPGLAEVSLTASHRAGAVRAEVYAGYRAASHLLPATSLFSVLGDTPAARAGTTLTWRAAPRLDVMADVGARDTSPELAARAKLRLDDRGASALGCELRRDAGWTGARGTARIALPRAMSLATELELVIPDDSHGLGTVWPWGLVALGADRGAWHGAIAVEASASPEELHRVDVLAQLGRAWGAK